MIRKRERGMALTGSLLAILLLMTILLLSTMTMKSGGDVVSNSDNALRHTRRESERATAQQLSDMGIRLTVQWMTQQTTPFPRTRAFAPSAHSNFFGATTAGNYSVLALDQTPTSTEMPNLTRVVGKVRVRIFPAFDNLMLRQLFLIESIGEYGRMQSANRALVQPKSFAYYGIIYDEPITAAWTAGLTRLSGPVHLNMRKPNTETVDPTASQNIYWNSTDPIFLHNQPDYLTVSGTKDQVAWRGAGGTIQTPGEANWPSIAVAGTEPTYNVPMIRFPGTALPVEEASLSSVAAPLVTGALIPSNGISTTGGIYIQGDVQNLILSTAGSGDTQQIATIEQTTLLLKQRTIITIDRASGTTRMQVLTAPLNSTTYTPLSDTTASGVTNGTLYVNGNIGNTSNGIGGLSGTIANNVVQGNKLRARSALTIATPWNKTVQIAGGIIYENLKTGGDADNPQSTATAATATSGTLGLVAGNVTILRHDRAGRELLEVGLHAALLTMGEFRVVNYDTRPSGNFRFIGSYAVRKQSAMGTFNTTTMARISGFNTTRTYDSRLAESPPPAFPETNDYKVLSYQTDMPIMP